MRLVDIDLVREGSKLGKSIYSADGRTLLGKGVILKADFIRRLKELGITSIYIEDKKIKSLGLELDCQDLISDEARLEAIQVTKQALENILRNKPLETRLVLKSVNRIIDELLQQEHLLVNITDIRTFDDYTFAHSVNVAVFSLIMGISLGYDQLKLRNLGVGALLHDVGKTKLPLQVLNKEGKLTDQEFTVVQEHSEKGFSIIKDSQELSILAAHVAYQHHEKFDGSGYPRKLKGCQISEFARIVAIADVYDALTANRPYRRGYLPHEAYEYLLATGGSHFDYQLIELFTRHVAPYPLGTLVRLSTGEKALVIQQNPECLLRPKVTVFQENREQISKSCEYCLADHPTIIIKEVLQE